MKLCDIYIGRLVRVTTSADVIGVVDAVKQQKNEKGESVVIRVKFDYCELYGKNLYTEAYPSELEPLTEEDM